MAIPNMSDNEMRMAIKELEQAIHAHDQWAENLFGTLICGLRPDDRDVGEESFRLCRFGQWYYQSGLEALEKHPGFAEIGIEHKRMHQCAASLLRSSANALPIPIRDYERFQATLRRMRLEVETVQRELADVLYNLDPLTGTPSRVGMLTNLREQGELAKRSVHTCAIAMMDLDHFKFVNDTYGHIAGDRVLIDFARHITANLRPYDKLFRYGGEEFLLTLPDTDLQSGRDVIDRLRKELELVPFETEGKDTFHVTVSFGLTLLDPDATVEQCIDRADKALYVAKAQGRNKVVVWNESMNGRAAEKVTTA